MSSERTYIGIDPGGSGSIVHLDERGDVIDTAGFHKVSDREVAETIARLVRDPRVQSVTIEQVGAFPGQGRSSAFRFGLVTGMAHGVCFACNVPMEQVTPPKWQRDLRVVPPPKTPYAERKALLREAASNRWPMERIGKTGKHDIADGLLIAEWGRLHGMRRVSK